MFALLIVICEYGPYLLYLFGYGRWGCCRKYSLNRENSFFHNLFINLYKFQYCQSLETFNFVFRIPFVLACDVGDLFNYEFHLWNSFLYPTFCRVLLTVPYAVIAVTYFWGPDIAWAKGFVARSLLLAGRDSLPPSIALFVIAHRFTHPLSEIFLFTDVRYIFIMSFKGIQIERDGQVLGMTTGAGLRRDVNDPSVCLFLPVHSSPRFLVDLTGNGCTDVIGFGDIIVN
jgi:hypothetical protein